MNREQKIAFWGMIAMMFLLLVIMTVTGILLTKKGERYTVKIPLESKQSTR